MENISNKSTKFGYILGTSIVLASLVFSATFYQSKKLDSTLNNTLMVTGSAKQKVTSDLVKWYASFSNALPSGSLSEGYSKMAQDEKKIVSFLKSKGIKDKDITISPVTVEQPYQYDRNAVREDTFRQSIQIQSDDVNKLTGLAKNISPLIDQGIVFATYSLEYYYSKLPQMRIDLLADAIKDAKLRAQKIAESSGQEIGAIKSASLGVVQVMTVNSVDVADYGSYDTSSIDKEVMVTVKAEFGIH